MRIAILKPSALGDIVHALPVLSALRGRYPESHLTWVVNKSFESLLVGHPDLNETLAFDRGAFGKGPVAATRAAWQFARELRNRKFDWAIDLQGLARTGLMTIATRAKRTVGFANAREGARFSYREKVAVPDAESIHAVDRYWRIVEHLGAGGQPKRFHVPVRAEVRERLTRDWHDWPRPWVAVAVGAKWLTKRWPPRHFAALVAKAQRTFGGTAIFVGVRDDSAISHEAMVGLPGPAHDLCGKTDLPTLAAALSLADVMLANDTGPLHLAAALGTPCVAPYLCTKIAKHGPYGFTAGAVETTVACAGSYVKQCPHAFACFDQLTADGLWPALEAALAKPRPNLGNADSPALP
jgi:ADP-heptose:LPS heptosyltransferase